VEPDLGARGRADLDHEGVATGDAGRDVARVVEDAFGLQEPRGGGGLERDLLDRRIGTAHRPQLFRERHSDLPLSFLVSLGGPDWVPAGRRCSSTKAAALKAPSLDLRGGWTYLPGSHWHSPLTSANRVPIELSDQRLSRLQTRGIYGQDQVSSTARPRGREAYRCRREDQGRHHHSRHGQGEAAGGRGGGG